MAGGDDLPDAGKKLSERRFTCDVSSENHPSGQVTDQPLDLGAVPGRHNAVDADVVLPGSFVEHGDRCCKHHHVERAIILPSQVAKRLHQVSRKLE